MKASKLTGLKNKEQLMIGKAIKSIESTNSRNHFMAIANKPRGKYKRPTR